MNTHAFGLKSSSAVANLAMRMIGSNSCDLGIPSSHKGLVEDIIKNGFYVDDLLTSLDTVEQARVVV